MYKFTAQSKERGELKYVMYIGNDANPFRLVFEDA